MKDLRISTLAAALLGLLALGCDREPMPLEPSRVPSGIAASVVIDQGLEPNDTCHAATDLGLDTLPLVIHDSLGGSPHPNGDVDFFRFASTPNALVTVDLEGQSTGQGTLLDPVLGAFDAGCGEIGRDDNGGSGLNSRLVLTIPGDGILVLGVTAYPDSAFNEGGSGSYLLTVQEFATPAPVAGFYFYPYEPSAFDVVQFSDWSYDPAGVGIASRVWDLGDGTTETGFGSTHQYADGDYTVRLTVTTYDGRTDSTSQFLQVRTRDVAITKFSVPRSASVGQTRTITVGVNSRRSPERVEVVLWKSVPGGFEYVGVLTQSVPVRSANRTTDFSFSYTFTSADAQVGKVTFKAIASIVGGRDALPADNEAIASPTKVGR